MQFTTDRPALSTLQHTISVTHDAIQCCRDSSYFIAVSRQLPRILCRILCRSGIGGQAEVVGRSHGAGSRTTEDGDRAEVVYYPRRSVMRRLIPSSVVADVRDSAGAGDWCTAGLVHRLAQDGVSGFLAAGPDDLRDAIRFGQAMAAWNCRFEGARGGMGVADVSEFRSDVMKILAGSQSSSVTASSSTVDGRQVISTLCVACGEASSSSKPPKRAKG